jgi:hypothetical protein
MYVLLNELNQVNEIFTDDEKTLRENYTKKFVDLLMYVDESVEVELSWVYDSDTETFKPQFDSI